LNAGIKKRGVRKHRKYPLAGILADNSKKDTLPKPSKTPLSELLAENPKMTKKEVRGLPKLSKTSEKCQKPEFNTKKPVDVY